MVGWLHCRHTIQRPTQVSATMTRRNQYCKSSARPGAWYGALVTALLFLFLDGGHCLVPSNRPQKNSFKATTVRGIRKGPSGSSLSMGNGSASLTSDGVPNEYESSNKGNDMRNKAGGGRPSLAALKKQCKDKQRHLASTFKNVVQDSKTKVAKKVIGYALFILFVFGGGHFPLSNKAGSMSFWTPQLISSQVKVQEVPLSQFYKYCEQQSGMKWGSRANVLVNTVTVDGCNSRLEYRLYRPQTKQQIKALKASFKDHSRESILESLPYTSAVTKLIDPNPSEIVTFMRQHNIDFQAVSRTGTGTTSRGISGTSTTLFAAWMTYRLLGNRFGLGSWGTTGTRVSSISGKRTSSSASTSNDMRAFDAIEGMGKAKEEVMELVDTLRNPSKYRIVGARAPKGILLDGPPGCGKTTLARATAASAGVPMLHCSGSEFVERYVGTGAARVRELFNKAAKIKGPCLIFIDEIDALGKARRDGGGNGNSDESEQTLNQLLACMDGLDSNSDICVLAATNRKDVLDPALVRPGRFDRVIRVDLPDQAGRERILRLHACKLHGFSEGTDVDRRRSSMGMGKTVNLRAVAEATDGLSGAELEAIVNEAAIRAVRRVSIQLNEGIDMNEVDKTVYPEDFEASVNDFFQSRGGKKPEKGRMGFDVESKVSGADSSIYQVREGIFKRNALVISERSPM